MNPDYKFDIQQVQSHFLQEATTQSFAQDREYDQSLFKTIEVDEYSDFEAEYKQQVEKLQQQTFKQDQFDPRVVRMRRAMENSVDQRSGIMKSMRIEQYQTGYSKIIQSQFEQVRRDREHMFDTVGWQFQAFNKNHIERTSTGVISALSKLPVKSQYNRILQKNIQNHSNLLNKQMELAERPKTVKQTVKVKPAKINLIQSIPYDNLKKNVHNSIEAKMDDLIFISKKK
ncbi:Hypothetical_protein [Hexamita inflata]|uniref:Hypothetical_protein n=1 Tax=Hexamita inflata TaxID=28002 RepID=A0AA86NAP9_9EUKA|nr:Hypothetical protein HINF_LOCUS3583 [Hexamita inflata]